MPVAKQDVTATYSIFPQRHAPVVVQPYDRRQQHPELETMGIVDDAVEDGVGEGWIAEHNIIPQYRNDWNDCHP
jgi:hypothetical protein